MAENQRPLRLMTYLVPGLPVELFETIAQYLEATLQQQTMLIYESRFNGPLSSRVDPFKADLADLGKFFIYCSPNSGKNLIFVNFSIHHWGILCKTPRGEKSRLGIPSSWRSILSLLKRRYCWLLLRCNYPPRI